MTDVEIANAAAERAIGEAVQLYFDGLYHSDVESLRHVFHPAATIIGYGSDGGLNVFSRDDFTGFVGGVTPPSKAGVPYDMEIVSIDIAGKAAAVKVRDLYLNRRFTDFLHLMEIDGNWKIIGKAFHSGPLGGADL